MRSTAAGAALITLLTAVAYIPALDGGFVWDDNHLISENPLIKTSDGLYRFWFTTEAADYYPLTWSLWWVEWRLWGERAAGYRVVNVLLHAVNAVLVWRVLQRLNIPGAWLAAAVFAVHPLNVATVAWISEQKNTLSMFFYLVAVLSYLRFDERMRWGWYALSLGAFLLALLSKTAVVMAPFVLLGCVWWRHGRMRWRDFFLCVPFLTLSLAAGLVTIGFHYHHVLRKLAFPAAPIFSRFATAGMAPWFYLLKALFPVDLMAVYPKWHADASRWSSFSPGLVLLGCFLVLWWKRKTWGCPLLFGLGYFVLMLFPVLGIFHQSFYRYSLVADHWQYYSIVAPIALIVAAGERIIGRWRERGRSWGILVSAALLVLLVELTWTRAGIYRTDETLWRDNVAKNPGAWVAHYNLAAEMQKAGKLQEAINYYEQALRLRPDYAEAESNLGITLAQAGMMHEAIERFERALRIDPNLANVHANLAHALMLENRAPEAIAHWEQALRLKPDWAEVHYDLGLALEQGGNTQEAIQHYQQALGIKPDMVDARMRLELLGVRP